MTMTSQFTDMTSLSNWRCRFSLAKFCYWSKFHVNNITGSRVITIFLYKGLTWNPIIRNTSAWVLLDIWRLRKVRDTKFDTNVSNKMLLNVEKCQGYSFYYFWIIKRKTKGGNKITPPPRLMALTLSRNLNPLRKRTFISESWWHL